MLRLRHLARPARHATGMLALLALAAPLAATTGAGTGAAGAKAAGAIALGAGDVMAATGSAAALPQSQYEIPPEGEGPRTPHPEAVKAIGRLKSPYCPGMLEVCPSAEGAALRDSIDQRARAGWDADRLVEWVVANHGEEYRALPRAEGAGLFAWIVPPLALAAGALVVLVALRRMRAARRAESPPALDRDLTEDEERRLREAVRDADAGEASPLL